MEPVYFLNLVPGSSFHFEILKEKLSHWDSYQATQATTEKITTTIPVQLFDSFIAENVNTQRFKVI